MRIIALVNLQDIVTAYTSDTKAACEERMAMLTRQAILVERKKDTYDFFNSISSRVPVCREAYKWFYGVPDSTMYRSEQGFMLMFRTAGHTGRLPRRTPHRSIRRELALMFIKDRVEQESEEQPNLTQAVVSQSLSFIYIVSQLNTECQRLTLRSYYLSMGMRTPTPTWKIWQRSRSKGSMRSSGLLERAKR